MPIRRTLYGLGLAPPPPYRGDQRDLLRNVLRGVPEAVDALVELKDAPVPPLQGRGSAWIRRVLGLLHAAVKRSGVDETTLNLALARSIELSLVVGCEALHCARESKEEIQSFLKERIGVLEPLAKSYSKKIEKQTRSEWNKFEEQCDLYLMERAELIPRALVRWNLSQEGDCQTPPQLESLLDELQLDLPRKSILFACRSGSALYDLAVETSDQDYFIVFAHDTRDLFRLKEPRELYESHEAFSLDKSGAVEFSAMEAAFFVDVLLKGNPRNLEFLFASEDKILYESPLWKCLKSCRSQLLSKRVVDQFLGFIGNRISKACKAHESSGEEKARSLKYLYHAWHKLLGLESLLAQRDLYVTIGGRDRDKILELRRSVGVESVPELIKETESRKKFLEVKSILLEIVESSLDCIFLPQEANTELLKDWLLQVRYEMQ